MEDSLIKKLLSFDYIKAIVELANDDSEKGRYLEFFSPVKNKLIRLNVVKLIDEELEESYELLDTEANEKIKLTEDASTDFYGSELMDALKETFRKYGATEMEKLEMTHLINEEPTHNVLKEGFQPIDELYLKHLEAKPEELFISDSLIPLNLKKKLLKNIDALRDSKEPDWHPGSNQVVNDIIHPSLYPHILEEVPTVEEETDFWVRKYRSSKYQWLPTDFVIDQNLQAKIKKGGFINNMPEEGFTKLVTNIEKMVSLCIPAFETVWQYTRTAEITNEDDTGCKEMENQETAPYLRFEGKTIQIIPKIAEYVFEKDASYEGVWHFEGMSHENIVATAVYFLQVDEGLEGGELEFKRGYTDIETGTFYFGTRQYPLHIFRILAGMMKPLGKIQTKEDLLLVFPNSHAHKLSKITNKTNQTQRRKIVVLFLINPDCPIESSTGLERPQTKMTLEEAKEIRLKMMEERKASKEDLNTRDIHLCEH